MSAVLSVSIVSYAPDLAVLQETLRTLGTAVAQGRSRGSLQEAKIVVLDNGPGTQLAPALRTLEPSLSYEVVSGHGNVGYGRANNLALLASQAEFHLVLNPDVSLEPDALHEALRFMAANPQVIILAPEARDAAGEPLYLCKRYPSVLALALRGFAPPSVRKFFEEKLARYEMRDLPRDRPSMGIPLLSGSFMFCRRAPVAAIGGFADDFFLYFEDYDLSVRAAARGDLAWVPAVRITHRGGHAARKGPGHVRLFVASAVKFFNRHGWKWA